MSTGGLDDPNAVHGDSGLSEAAARRLVSRCSVCEVEGSVLTRHSMTTELPGCPKGWTSMWAGYSYQSVSVSCGKKCLFVG